MIYCWEQIRKDYIQTELSQRALAQKYGVSVRQISRKSKKEGWLEQKMRYFQEKAKLEKDFSEDCVSLKNAVAEKFVGERGVDHGGNGAGSSGNTGSVGGVGVGDVGSTGGGVCVGCGENGEGNGGEKTVEISTLTDKLCQKANIAIDRLEGDALDAQKLRQLVQSVKDLKELKRAEEENNDTGRLEKLIQGLCDL